MSTAKRLAAWYYLFALLKGDLSMHEKLISQVMREMGRRGGKKRIEDLSPAERTALAKKAAAKSAEVRSKKAAAKKKLKAKTEKE
jgi:hypothetical protein